ncbi:hypothetical protein [Thermithiobacillus plumbiphilus]|uniref:DUF3309 domain-containing protein n=1 Tax=Thermithiobacillus plumbiphilus TaxID=1729899 RepID=A0ABU9DB30_9PROT
MTYGLVGLVIAVLLAALLLKSVYVGGLGGIVLLVLLVLLLTGRL